MLSGRKKNLSVLGENFDLGSVYDQEFLDLVFFVWFNKLQKIIIHMNKVSLAPENLIHKQPLPDWEFRKNMTGLKPPVNILGFSNLAEACNGHFLTFTILNQKRVSQPTGSISVGVFLLLKLISKILVWVRIQYNYKQ